jgi:hypothetical protein
MDIDQLRKRYPDEEACRSFFESAMWRNGRFCPYCPCDKSYRLCGKSVRTNRDYTAPVGVYRMRKEK